MGMSGDTALTLAKNYVKKTLQGQGALKGQDGFSPIVTENKDNTNEIYKLDITTKDGTFTTPNLRGKDGESSGGGEANVIESISVNGTPISVDENKNVDITVPSIDGLAKTEDIPTKVSELTNDSGYLTEHQDISGKVDKVEGKSLISDTEIARLASVDNYDDTDIRTELANKADTTSIPRKVSELTNDSNYQTAEQVNSTVTTEIAKVVADAPEDLNTLKEMSDWIAGHENDASAMNSAISDNKTAITALQTGKADKSEIPTVPTNVSEFINDAGYLTEHQDISNLVVKEEGKGLSSNDYTSEEKTKLGGMGTSQGRNLIPYPYSQTTKTVYGVTFTDNKDGSIGISGTQDGGTVRPYMGIGIWWNETDRKKGNISISANTYFTISANCNSNNAGLRYFVYDESGSKLADSTVYGNNTKTLKFDVDAWVALCIETAANSGIYDCICKPQLELGSIAHAYEPPVESNVNLKVEVDKISTSQGRNLIHYPYYNGTSYELNGITYTVNEADGTITVNGTATKESDFRLINPYEPSGRKTLELGQTYTLSDSVNQPNGIGYQAPVYFQFVRIDTTKNDFNYGISTNYGNMTWTASDANLLQYGIRIVVRSGVTVDNVVMKPMLEIGDIAHSYEPTTESNISLKSAIDGKADKCKVADTDWTDCTLQGDFTGFVKYRVKNGICFVWVSDFSSDTAMSLGNQLVCAGLPKHDLNADTYWGLTTNSLAPFDSLILNVNSSQELRTHVGTNSAKYFGSFSYPVAES